MALSIPHESYRSRLARALSSISLRSGSVTPVRSIASSVASVSGELRPGTTQAGDPLSTTSGARGSHAATDLVIGANQVTISHVKLRGFGVTKKNTKLYIKMSVGNITKKASTKVRRGELISWEQMFTFNAIEVSPTLDLRIRIHDAARFFGLSKGDLIGELNENLESLLPKGNKSAVITRRLVDKNLQELVPELEFLLTMENTVLGDLPASDIVHRLDTVRQLSLLATSEHANNLNPIMPSSMTPPHEDEQLFMATAVVNALPEILVSQALQDAGEEVCHMARPYHDVPTVPDQVGKLVIDTKSAIQVWSPLLEKIHIAMQLVDGIAEIHPYAKMAWSIVSLVPKAFIAQIYRDDAIITLLESLDNMCECICEVKDLQANLPQQKIIAQMTCQIIECAGFIKNYAENHNFGRRFVANLSIFSDTDKQIKLYNYTIQNLQQALQEKIILQSGIRILHILDAVQNQAAIIDLNDIPYASGAKYQMEKSCLPGTREDIIDSICGWVNNKDNKTPRVMFLAGVAGSGKSAIAHTVAQIFYELKLLGSSFFFDQSKAAVLHPGILFSTIARDLADLDPYFKIKLSEATQERAKRTTSSVSEQFEEFLNKENSPFYPCKQGPKPSTQFSVFCDWTART